MVRMQAKVNNVLHGMCFKQVQMKRTKMIMGKLHEGDNCTKL